MVRVGDTYRCDKSNIRRTGMFGYLSKGKFTLLDLGPRSTNSGYLDDSIKVKDCNGAEGWASIKKFISYSRKSGEIARQWMTAEELRSSRASEATERRIQQQLRQRQRQREAAAAAAASTSNAAAPAVAPVTGTVIASPKSSSDINGSLERGGAAGSSRVPLDGSVAGAKAEMCNKEPVPKANESQPARPVEPSTSSKKRTADQMEEDHLEQLKKIQEEGSEAIKKIKMEQERKMKMLKLEHTVEMLNTKLEEANRELEEFKAEGNAD